MRQSVSAPDRRRDRAARTASISRVAIERTGVSRASVNFGLKQIVQCGFVTISVGRRHINTFRFADDWKSLDADEAKRRVALAKLPKPPVARALPPKPVKPPKPPKVERPRYSQRRMPSLPSMPWRDDGR